MELNGVQLGCCGGVEVLSSEMNPSRLSSGTFTWFFSMVAAAAISSSVTLKLSGRPRTDNLYEQLNA